MSYGADTDGVDHINVNSIGKTLLGMMLYNGSFSPIVIPEFGTFTSIHGFWAWLITGRRYDIFKYLYGEEAFARIKGLPIVQDPELRDLITRAIQLKIQQNLTLNHLFRQNAYLPYVSYGPVNHEPLNTFLDEWTYDDRWTLDLFSYLQAQKSVH